jgi:iron complex transport system substrate-binding protein
MGCERGRERARRDVPLAPTGDGTARRIVSLTPSTTEILFALEVGDRVVGVSRYCDFPPAATMLPRVGGFTDPSLEAILALSPDLVVGARGPSNRGVVETLASLGIATAFPPDGTLDDVRASIRDLGARVGAGRRAEALVAAIDADLLAIRTALGGRRPVRTLVVLGSRPLSVAGPGGFLDDVLRAAGGENVVRDGPPWPTIGVERVLDLAPEVIVEAGLGMGGEPGLDWSRWPSIPAVRDGRVVRIDDVRLLRPGPRVAEAVALLARALHPDAVLPGFTP